VPLANRVAPDGSLIATPARGLFMGNRGGRIHDPATRLLTRRRWTGRAWICCLLSFKGRPSPGVWGAARYTELFFCDEVTALSAGHRPCVECRRADAFAWREAALRGTGRDVSRPPRFPELDAILHEERLDGRGKRRHRLPAEDLPDGAMVAAGSGAEGESLALRGDAALPWRSDGYGLPRPRPRGLVDVLTPPLSLAALRGLYRPVWHPSAG
jgi:hypothetical protein